MAANWKKTVKKLRSFVGGGLDRGTNLASWAVAGGVAYYLWVKPSQDLQKQYAERAALAAATDIEKSKPGP